MAGFVELSAQNIDQEHICCAISDRKCAAGYRAKKEWLKEQFQDGYVFKRLDARAKVFMEYGPAEKAWVPISAPNYLNINCFWVSGKYKKNGYGKALLQAAYEDAKAQGKAGLVEAVGTRKFHFMSDTQWLLRQGFIAVDRISNGFSLLALRFEAEGPPPQFLEHLRNGTCPEKEGLVAHYSNRCPFAEFHARETLEESAAKRNLPLKIIALRTREEAQKAPSPATIFSLFLNGRFVTPDLSVCVDKRFDKVLAKAGICEY